MGRWGLFFAHGPNEPGVLGRRPQGAPGKRCSCGMALPADAFANMVMFAMSQPDDIDINEILFRPVSQEL